MTANIGKIDRGIRYLLALVALILVVTRRVSGPLAVVVGIIGAALLITAFINYCWLYTLLGISTSKKGR
ncbi:MAG TPA: DUF2892 domain-containing protein [Candidatus Bathyarchaeia archaeon]|nr:DUF2892 domain-containing protein [Candidatus Bathyarchaeia archaeon]